MTAAENLANAAPAETDASPGGKRAFLAPELGAGEASGGPRMSVRKVMGDPVLRQMAVNLLKQMREGGSGSDSPANQAGRDLVAEAWKPGPSEQLSSSSSAAEIKTALRRMELRADYLEAMIEETVAEIERLRKLLPAPPPPPEDPGASPEPPPAPVEGATGG